MNDRPLVSEEEERLVGLVEVRNAERAAHCAAKLVALERVDGLAVGGGVIAEVRCCIQVAIADELEQVAVIMAGSALGNNVNHAAGVLAVLGVVVAGLDAELLQC